METEEGDKLAYREVRRGITSPSPWLLVTLVLALTSMAFVVVSSDAPMAMLVPVCSIGAIFVGAVALISAFYFRTVELTRESYAESARVWRWILWSEERRTSDMQLFSVRKAAGTEDDDDAVFHIMLNMKSGESRFGMAYWDEELAKKTCAKLNDILLAGEASKNSVLGESPN